MESVKIALISSVVALFENDPDRFNFNLDEVADAAGVQTSLINRHFGGKLGLIEAGLADMGRTLAVAFDTYDADTVVTMVLFGPFWRLLSCGLTLGSELIRPKEFGPIKRRPLSLTIRTSFRCRSAPALPVSE